jgi:hypothetical protein
MNLEARGSSAIIPDRRIFTKEAFLDECRRVAAEMNAKRKTAGSTVDLTTGYYADVGASAWATIWQAIEDKPRRSRLCV